MNLTPLLRLTRLAGVLAGGLLLGACSVSTVASRIRELPSIYSTATPTQQRVMQEGGIDAGFTPNMVYIALGEPDRIERPDSQSEVWTYWNFAMKPAMAAIGKPKLLVTQTTRPLTVSNARTDYAVRPDMGTADVPEDVPQLHVYFYMGVTTSVKMETNH